MDRDVEERCDIFEEFVVLVCFFCLGDEETFGGCSTSIPPLTAPAQPQRAVAI